MQMWTWLSRAPLELVHLVAPRPRALRFADLNSIDAIVCDCDGVLFHGTKAIAGVPEAIAELRRRGKQILFVTNAATQSRASLATKLKNLGYAGVDASHCVTSASAAASFLHTNCSGVRSAYVVGEKGLVDELALVGIEALGANDTGGLKSLQAEKFDQDVGRISARETPTLAIVHMRRPILTPRSVRSSQIISIVKSKSQMGPHATRTCMPHAHACHTHMHAIRR